MSTLTPLQTGFQPRLRWMDLLRGVAILALLVLHASSIPLIYHGIVMPQPIATVNNILGPYRMPLLMFLSGMLLGKSLSRPLLQFYDGKIRKLLWPYLLWASIFLAVTDQLPLLFSPAAWVPVTYVWFLLFVFLYYCAAPLVVRVPPVIVPAVAILLSVMISDRGFISKFVLFSAYFYLGHQLSASPRARRVLGYASTRWALLTLAVVAILVAPVWFSSGSPMGRLASVVVSFTGIFAAVGWAEAFYPNPGSGYLFRYVGRPIESMGRRSIVYYLSHYPIMLVVSAVVESLAGDAFWLVFSVNIIASLAFGALLVLLSRGLPFKLLFEFPRTCAEGVK